MSRSLESLGLFVEAESEKNSASGNKGFLEEKTCCLERTDESIAAVGRTSTPDEGAVVVSRQRRMSPFRNRCRINRDGILMSCDRNQPRSADTGSDEPMRRIGLSEVSVPVQV